MIELSDAPRAGDLIAVDGTLVIIMEDVRQLEAVTAHHEGLVSVIGLFDGRLCEILFVFKENTCTICSICTLNDSVYSFPALGKLQVISRLASCVDGDE